MRMRQDRAQGLCAAPQAPAARARACMVVLNSCRSASSVTRPATRLPTYTCCPSAQVKKTLAKSRL